MRLGVIYTEEVHNAGYRAIWPAEALRRRGGHQVELVSYAPGANVDYERLLDCDTVHIFRRSDRYVIRAADEFRARGIGVVYDNDDDIRLAPKEAGNYKEVGGIVGQRDFRTQANMMRRAHVVTTTTDTLADRWRHEYDGAIEVIPNYLAGFHLAKGPGNGDGGVVIGWFAGREHMADEKRLRISHVLQRVMERRPEVRVVTMGVRLSLPASRYTHHEYIPLESLVGHVRRFDIGIAPIADIPMSYARSDIKVKEYAAAGVPWVASNRGGYAQLGSGCGGVLADDDAWEAVLLSLVSSRFRRAQLRRQGRRWAKIQGIDRNVDRWLEVWERAAALAKTTADSGHVVAAR